MGPPGAGGFGGGPRTSNPYATNPHNNAGSRTPGWGASRTPNPYGGEGRTPAWNASSRTPNPYAEGGKTPAWNASSRTPNPYATDGGRTPAWNANSRTPNPYASGSSSSGTGTWGGATPGRSSTAWGGATPGRAVGGWGSGVDSWSNDSGWGVCDFEFIFCCSLFLTIEHHRQVLLHLPPLLLRDLIPRHQ
jgi:transcription elongation factor SPT5